MNGLSSRWQKVVVWLTGYSNLIAFVLGGGFIFMRSEDDDVKESCKTVLFLVGAFTAVELLRGIIYNLMNVFGADYNALSVLSTVATVVAIIKTIAFATLFVLDFLGIKLRAVKSKEEKAGSEAE